MKLISMGSNSRHRYWRMIFYNMIYIISMSNALIAISQISFKLNGRSKYFCNTDILTEWLVTGYYSCLQLLILYFLLFHLDQYVIRGRGQIDICGRVKSRKYLLLWSILLKVYVPINPFSHGLPRFVAATPPFKKYKKHISEVLAKFNIEIW